MAKIKLAVLGDSLSQGFMSGAIYRPDLSYPVFLSWCLGERDLFSYQTFSQEFGLPLNLEVLLRQLTNRFGGKIFPGKMLPLTKFALGFAENVEGFWDHKGRYLTNLQTLPFSNQSVWGYRVEDADSLTVEIANDFLGQYPPQGGHFFRDLQIPFYTTAKMTLNPLGTKQGEKMTQLDNLRLLASQRGIENLVFWLGANNALGAVARLKIKLSTSEVITNFHHQTNANLYHPEHFEFIYRRVADKLQSLGAERVFVATIPYVTVPPITRGVSFNQFNLCPDGYYEYYTRPWIWDDEFNPKKHPYLTGKEAKMIDSYIDQYNEIIKRIAVWKGWYVVELGQLLSKLAYRRQRGEVETVLPRGLGSALARNPLTAYLVDEQGKVALDTRYLEIRLTPSPQIIKGGLFSLDGVHPTTIGYGIIADAFLKVMAQAGVEVKTELPWDFIVASDQLITNPPTMLEGLREFFVFLRSTKVFNSNLLEMVIPKGIG